jgi:pyrroloquinoline quinone biosynthesis protein B
MRACLRRARSTVALLLLLVAANGARAEALSPWLVVLGVGQDGGVPQAGDPRPERWADPAVRRRVVSIGLVAPASARRWLFEATPDLPAQLAELDRIAPVPGPAPRLAGIFLTHAHIGHYLGLAFLGHEAIGARGVPIHVMPRMASFLEENGPWDQLVRYGNVRVERLAAEAALPLGDGLSVTPLLVPHRQEYSEVVAFRIDGPHRSVLFLPDIDSWKAWDEAGTRLEDVLATVDVAYLDATFFADGELPGRDMSGFPHPFVRTTMDRLASLPEDERGKVRFIHLNHTNPALDPASAARAEIEARGFRVAEEGERVGL